MASGDLRAAILIISETAAQDPTADKCIPLLQQVFEAEERQTWKIAETKIVPDNVIDIQRAVMAWADGTDRMNLIVTSGGTGFATKDYTPEAINPLIHRHAPGLVHGMLAASLAVTPFAVMSRPIAGVRNGSLILTLPGSPKGAKENLESVIKMLPHACLQAAGGDSRSMHVGGVKKLEQDAGVAGKTTKTGTEMGSASAHSHSHHDPHHHHHSHGNHSVPQAHTAPSERPQSNDPLAGPSQRNRESPYPLLSVEDALSRIGENTPTPLVQKLSVDTSIVGCVVAADISAAEPVPAFRASIVDGYAVKTPGGKNAKGTFPVVFAAHAQAAAERTLKEGEIARITTGAPLPEGADAVVMVEDTVVKSTTSDGREEATVEILTDEVKTGENVREVGSDVRQGDVVMRKGEGISAVGGEFGLLASVGVREVPVYRKPVVGVLSTGDEIVNHSSREPGALKMGEVRDTNRPTLLTAVRHAGFEVMDLGIVSDKATALDSQLRQSLLKVDVLITSGGVSMGELDLLKPTLERSLGGTIHFGRVAMKPGKPTTFATIPSDNLKDPQTGQRASSAYDRKVVFSLPGNPASAVVTFLLFVLPSLHQMVGVEPRGLPRVAVKMDGEVRCDAKREEYHRVVVGAKPGDDALWALSTGGQRSSRIGSFKGANALVRLPAGGGVMAKGAKGEALLMGPIAGL